MNRTTSQPPRTGADYVPLVARGSHAGTSDDDPPRCRPKPRARNPLERVGTTGILALTLGSAVLVLPLVALALFWRMSMMATGAWGDPPKLWFNIIAEDWSAQIVTLCSAVMRSAVMLQASLATALFAALILEAVGTPLLGAPFFSILRAVSVAPIALLSTTSVRPRGVFSFFLWALVVLEVLLTMASQFLSTILLSDFGCGGFNNLANTTDVPVFEDLQQTKTSWWQLPPTSSWTFAELSEPFAEGPNHHDTGHTYRAFLPFQKQEQRETLRKFHGPAVVMDQRVVCANPSLVNLTLDTIYQSYTRLAGQIGLEEEEGTYSMFQHDGSQRYINFTCALPTQGQMSNATEGETSICLANDGRDWPFLLEDPLVPPVDFLVDSSSTMFMILDVVSADTIIKGEHQNRRVEVARSDGPWSMVTNGTDGEESLRVTACVTNLAASSYTVDISSSWGASEPTVPWDRKSQSFDTEASRRQLGASRTPGSLSSRGVLELGPKTDWEAFETSDSLIHTQWYFMISMNDNLPNPGQMPPPDLEGTPDLGILLTQGLVTEKEAPHKTHMHLFQHTFQETRSPALAMQALLARVSQMAYYEQLPEIDLRLEEVSTVFATAASIPVRWRGFAAATAIGEAMGGGRIARPGALRIPEIPGR